MVLDQVVEQKNLIVFYDQLSTEFLEKYSTDRVSFVRCKLGNYSLNDERFFIFREFISQLSPETYVITTDINDVVFNRKPLPLLLKEHHLPKTLQHSET